MLGLLRLLVVENQQKLEEAISKLEPFPDLPAFTELRSVQDKLKYSSGTFSLTQVRAGCGGSCLLWTCAETGPCLAGGEPLSVSGLVRFGAADQTGGPEAAEQAAP